MNRAQLYLWSLLQSVDQMDERILSELAGKASEDLPIADPEQRKSDMDDAIGAWRKRPDLPDSRWYIAALRNEIRAGGTVLP
jgi:hypothetical protein